MSKKIGDNFSYGGQLPNFERDQFQTKAEMDSISPLLIDDGHISFCIETREHYCWDANATPPQWIKLTSDSRLSDSYEEVEYPTSTDKTPAKIGDSLDVAINKLDTSISGLHEFVQYLSDSKANLSSSLTLEDVKKYFSYTSDSITTTKTLESLDGNNIYIKYFSFGYTLPEQTLEWSIEFDNNIEGIGILDFSCILQQDLGGESVSFDYRDQYIFGDNSNILKYYFNHSTNSLIIKFTSTVPTTLIGSVKFMGSSVLAENSYSAAIWNPNDLSPDSSEIYGDPEFADQWYPYLFNVNSVLSSSETLGPVGKLKRNNWFRFEDGSWAPVVGITEERRAECDGDLYFDSSLTNKYCSAGEFNAEEFYDSYGVDTKLYNSSGLEVNILRPWETTSSDYTIAIGRPDTVYVVDGEILTDSEGNENYIKGIFSTPNPNLSGFGELELTDKNKLIPTAISPGCCCTVNGAARNFFYLYAADHANCRGHNSPGGCTIFNEQDRTYPRAVDISQYSAATFSRANNTNPNDSFPFAEGGYHAYNVFLTSQEILNRTKYLHHPDKFSSGISSNNSCNSETNWLKNGGLRYKIQGSEDEWTYTNFSSAVPSSFGYYYNTSNVLTKYECFSYALNGYYPKEQCLESQIVASYISERGIEENTHFNLYGNEYWWNSVKGAAGLLDQNGRMNARIYKLVKGSLTGYPEIGGDAVTVDIESVLRVGLINGVNASGDIFAYIGGGIEAVGTTVEVASGFSTKPYPLKIYSQPNQREWHTPLSTSYLDNLGEFDFENNYPLLYETDAYPVSAGGYVKRKKEYTPYGLTAGASIGTGECYYQYTTNYWGYTTLDRRVRIGLRFRGYSSYSYCSPRSLFALYSVAITYAYYSFFAQILLGDAQA